MKISTSNNSGPGSQDNHPSIYLGLAVVYLFFCHFCPNLDQILSFLHLIIFLFHSIKKRQESRKYICKKCASLKYFQIQYVKFTTEICSNPCLVPRNMFQLEKDQNHLENDSRFESAILSDQLLILHSPNLS